MNFTFARLLVAMMIAIFLISPATVAEGQNYRWMRFKHANSGMYLVQTWSGDRDDKRNTTVWAGGGDETVWVLIPVETFGYESDGDFVTEYLNAYYVINLKTGLVLTQDNNGTDNNVSCWGMYSQNSKADPKTQHWYWRDRPKQYSKPYVHLINRATGDTLTQYDGGLNPDKNNVTAHEFKKEKGRKGWGSDWKPERPGRYASQEVKDLDLVMLTIHEVECVHASTGQDAGTKILFQGIQTVAEAAISGGASWASRKLAQTAGKEIAKKAVKESVKTTLKQKIKQGVIKVGQKSRDLAKAAGKEIKTKTKEVFTKKYMTDYAKRQMSFGGVAERAMKKAALEAANKEFGADADSLLELAFNKAYGESPDQLEIKVNGISVWPNGGRDWRHIKSQQTLQVNSVHISQLDKVHTIQLVEYDHGSGDDSLGWITIDTSILDDEERFDQVLVANKSEGSVYWVTYSIKRFKR